MPGYTLSAFHSSSQPSSSQPQPQPQSQQPSSQPLPPVIHWYPNSPGDPKLNELRLQGIKERKKDEQRKVEVYEGEPPSSQHQFILPLVAMPIVIPRRPQKDRNGFTTAAKLLACLPRMPRRPRSLPTPSQDNDADDDSWSGPDDDDDAAFESENPATLGLETTVYYDALEDDSTRSDGGDESQDIHDGDDDDDMDIDGLQDDYEDDPLLPAPNSNIPTLPVTHAPLNPSIGSVRHHVPVDAIPPTPYIPSSSAPPPRKRLYKNTALDSSQLAPSPLSSWSTPGTGHRKRMEARSLALASDGVRNLSSADPTSSSSARSNSTIKHPNTKRTATSSSASSDQSNTPPKHQPKLPRQPERQPRQNADPQPPRVSEQKRIGMNGPRVGAGRPTTRRTS